MRAFTCPVCRGFVSFEARHCPNCAAELGLHILSRAMFATKSNAAVIDGQIWIACTKAADLGCNWLVPQEQELDGQRGRCLAHSLIRREPDADDTIAPRETGIHRYCPAALGLSAHRYRPTRRPVLAHRRRTCV